MKRSFETGVGGVVMLVEIILPSNVDAACTSTAPPSNTTVTCTGASTLPVITPSTSTGVTINLDPTTTASFVRSSTAVGFSVDHASAITNNGNFSLTGAGSTGTARGAVLLGATDNNQLTNAATGVISTTGAFNDGMAANGSGNTLTNNGRITTTGPNAYGMTAAWGQTNAGQLNNTLVNTGTVSTSGSNARAMSILGGNGVINNSGTLSTTGATSTTAYMQGNNDTLINTGSISASGSGSDAVFSNTVSTSFTARIENRAGGSIVSQNGSGIRTLNANTTIVNAGLVQSGIGTAITMGNGSNSLILQTGSVINGTADGGAGNNTVTLQGTGTATNAFIHFQTLLMQGTQWDWTGTGTFTTARVQSGTLNLLGTLGSTTGALVDPGATLQATSQNLPSNVTDNGLVRFAQTAAGTYTGLIAGTGVVEKSGAGTLTLAPAAAGGNTYSGGTLIDGGTLAVSADGALGATSGSVTFDGGTLQLGQSFDLAATRAITLNAGGGTIDTQAFSSMLAQPVSGAGGLTKLGSGSLTMNGVNTYSGATNVAAGTLALGDAAHVNTAVTGGGNTTVASGATLGGYGTVVGAVSNSGTVAVANALPVFAGSANGSFTINGSLVNAGLVQIGGNGVGNQLIVNGNYTGQSGVVALSTVVEADGAASDRLVLSGGTGSGSTSLKVTNVGGNGTQTVANGIEIVAATQGAGTTPDAFTLAAPVKAGAYSYYLAKGGVTDGTSSNWYLRNTVAPQPSAATPDGSIDVPVAAAGTPPLPAPPPAGSGPVPLYRPEVPVYAVMPAVARQLGVMQVDTFHERAGEQSLLTETGTVPAAWGRVWGGHSDFRGDGSASPGFDGSVFGAQAGHDLYADSTTTGHRNHYGVFAGFARATGDVEGFALGVPDLDAGHLPVNAFSLGGYWTHVGPGGWYTDAVLMGSSLTLTPVSRDNIGATTHGTAVTGSIEGGLPVPVTAGLTVEPQAQLIWQRVSVNDLNDGISTVGFNDGNTFLGRIGVRLLSHFDALGANWQPWLRLNVLRSFGEDDKATFAGTTVIGTAVGQTAGQIGAGVVGKISRSASIFATASWLTNLGGPHQRTVLGDAGVRWTW
ncbi:autotransporter outer membrane beta-barrel domain-containing protein [Paraburkholderia saeva]|uniref:autotransporter outer membrane beta-barrel domain-containing protein n=1 Tax=Paraburkholderia saeva TaxID=2777537 RepID=UPI001D8F8015|nr:autotransporter outer membrane beta-barrel domain-containing protein [Paraburkholderia saeva]CAG4889101.1 hypothetical protein R52603_00870 [Paraburkholderia saeva]